MICFFVVRESVILKLKPFAIPAKKLDSNRRPPKPILHVVSLANSPFRKMTIFESFGNLTNSICCKSVSRTLSYFPSSQPLVAKWSKGVILSVGIKSLPRLPSNWRSRRARATNIFESIFAQRDFKAKRRLLTSNLHSQAFIILSF